MTFPWWDWGGRTIAKLPRGRRAVDPSGWLINVAIMAVLGLATLLFEWLVGWGG